MKNITFIKDKKIILLVVLIILISFFSIIFLKKSFNNILSRSSENLLMEVSSVYSELFKLKVNDEISILQNTSLLFSNGDLSDSTSIRNDFNLINDYGAFKKFYIENISEEIFTSSGEKITNPYLISLNKKVLKYNFPICSENVIYDSDGDKGLLFSVPVLSNNQTIGVLSGFIPYNFLDKLFSEYQLNTKGYFYIVNDDGSIIMAYDNSNRLCYSSNFLDFMRVNNGFNSSELIDFENELKLGNSGLVYYSIGSNERLCFYSSIGINNWSILSCVPTSVAQNQFGNFTILFFAFVIFFILICFILIIIVTVTILNKEKMERNNEILENANNKNKSIIFEIDLQSQLITFLGDTTFIFGSDLNQINYADFQKIHVTLHEDDQSLFDKIKSIMNVSYDDFYSEFRILCSDKKYYWYKIEGTTVFDSKNKPYKFMGNLTNVNQQVIKENELKTKADYDSLSGLLNKGAFETSVKKFLETKKDVYAVFFVLDLDNFKSVNDTLGHSMGDCVIADVSKKLYLNFSVKDYIGRFGGDEFSVFSILNETFDKEKALAFVKEKASTLCEILNELYFNDKASVEVSCSVGIALYPDSGTTFEELFEHADFSLYSVKQGGKNGYKLFNKKDMI